MEQSKRVGWCGIEIPLTAPPAGRSAVERQPWYVAVVYKEDDSREGTGHTFTTQTDLLRFLHDHADDDAEFAFYGLTFFKDDGRESMTFPSNPPTSLLMLGDDVPNVWLAAERALSVITAHYDQLAGLDKPKE